MRFVEPAVFMIFKSMPLNDEIYRWLKHIGCSEETCNKFAYHRYAADGSRPATAAERGIELAGRRCYNAFEPGLNPNVTSIRESIESYLDNILKQKHGSVLAHFTFTFAIEGISRVLTAELNRHAVGTAISEGSGRYIRYSDIPFVDVPSIMLADEEPTTEDELLNARRRATRDYIGRCVATIESFYDSIANVWEDVLNGPDFAGKKHITSMMRRIAPMGLATGGVWTFSIRSLRHVLTMRGAEAAEEEILRLAVIILERMKKEEPVLFGDFNRNEKGFYQPKYEKV